MCKQQGKETYTQVNKEKEPTEIDAGWTQPLDLADKNKKLLLRSKNVKLLNTCLDSEFLDLTPKVKATKTKSKQVGLPQIKKTSAEQRKSSIK